MKRFAFSIVFALTLGGSALADGIAIDMPRLDFGTGGGDVTQDCDPRSQPCED